MDRTFTMGPTLDHSEEVAEADEPPERQFKITPKSAYTKAIPPYARRESLLTRQLHSETEHSDEDHFARTHSTASVWSNPSVASTAELTSDDGRSAPSPAISPPLPPTAMRTLPVIEKPLNTEPKILGLETISKDPVEAGLGRKRCITFACGNKEKPKPVVTAPASPPKRKCMLRFVCPSKPVAANPATPVKRAASPAPKHRRSSSSLKSKSASPASPRLLRKSPILEKATPKKQVRPVIDSDSGAEATKFHEFASSEDEPDEWTQESTCYRNRLCVSDTLKKENVIRQLAEEVEEEAIDEEDEDQEDQEDDIEDELVEESESDDGFHSDDEHGFAVSDSDEEGSENEWWTPAAISTAATSTEHLDSKITPRAEMDYGSSLASNSSAGLSPHSRQRRPRAFRTHSKSSAMAIERPPTPDLPDSTDFVCGTLDEDRPKEQEYIKCMKQREAAKHPVIPQDIDPTFPTSDPEMDEEDDEDLEDADSSDGEAIMHGSLDSIHGTARPASPTPRRDIKRASPAPTVRLAKSPAPKARLGRSPAPRHRSPAPLALTRTKSPAPRPRARSPAPIALTRTITRSPAPKQRARSPAPRKLFGNSPRRLHSPPAHAARMTSPPNTRRASPNIMPCESGLAGRPNTIAITASLPKRPGGFLLSRLGMHSPDESEDTVGPESGRGGRRRGAIDIVKGLEKKKQRRREKLCQKMAAKAAARGEVHKKVKPGRGCERMREVGLELQKYKGGANHIISY